MCTNIDRIETAGPTNRARRLFLDDGSQPRLTSAAAVKQLGLQPGLQVHAGDLAASLDRAEPQLARERALSLLGYREHSRQELVRKLQGEGYPETLVTDLANRFVDVQLVSDVRFAEMWARSRLAAGYGPRRIVRELGDRGIDEETARAALAEHLTDEDELHRATASLRGRTPVDLKSRERIVRRLVSRGYSLAVALQAASSQDLECRDELPES